MSFSSSPKCSALSLFYVLPDGIINQFSLKSSVVGHTITIVDTEVKLMSLWRKRLGKNLWDVTMSLLKKRQGALGDVSGRDRHTVKKAVPAMARKHVFSRRFYYLGGLYLATIVVLLLFAFLRLGVIPAPEVPGLDKDWTGLTNDEQAGESMPEEADSHARTGTGAGQQGFASPESQPVESSPAHTGENFMPAEEDPIPLSQELLLGEPFPDTDGEAAGVEDDVAVSPPASPLPSWYLHTAYGDYASEDLPSGGLLHHRTRGILLAGTPGASVSALWDGTVVTAGEKSFPYGNFVVLEHEGGYSTLYGNLREIWVKEGDEVSRGENIGLLPHTPTARENEAKDKAVAGSSEYEDVVAAAGLNEQDGEPNSASTNSDKQALPSGMLPFRTVAGGIDAALYGTPDIGEKKIYPSFHEENPLLYLELRRNNRYMDPLLFIEERN